MLHPWERESASPTQDGPHRDSTGSTKLYRNCIVYFSPRKGHTVLWAIQFPAWSSLPLQIGGQTGCLPFYGMGMVDTLLRPNYFPLRRSAGYVSLLLPSCSVVSDSLRTWGRNPPSSSVHGQFLVHGKKTGVGCQALLLGIFLTQGSKPHLLHLLHFQADSLPLNHQGIPFMYP